ncbi:B-cell linker protein-like isoform X2 [Gigantopelta aegis]|uniref:B-cell linker protein-like isoform X2 n=1 Tax=Gigantopelta aegis TaxID=1735272 RepID=UPI001B88AA36|nr:B-cell linker protein-like isoform X2 [Gigantopelta aegis]
MATKSRPPMALPGRHADPMSQSSGDIPPPLPPSRRPAPTPPQEEPPLPARLPPSVPKGRHAPQDDEYDEFDIDHGATNGSMSPPLPSPPAEQEYDDWQNPEQTNEPELYEVPDDITPPKPVGRPALPARNAHQPPVPQTDEVYEDPDDNSPSSDAQNEMVYEDPEADGQDEYEFPDENSSSSAPPPSLPSRPANRAPVPVPPSKHSKPPKKPTTSTSTAAPGINIDTGALGSALKGLKRVTNNSTPKEVEHNATVGSEISTQKINIKDAINKFETGVKPAMSPKPKGFSSPVSVHSVSSVSSTESNHTPLSPHPVESTKESVSSAKDMPLPPVPNSEEVFDEIYDECASNLLASYPWYHGSLGREDADRKLKQLKEDGSFLVRDSKKSPDQPYTLVLLYNNTVKNLKVRLRKDNKIALGEEKKDEINFKDVIEMVEHHKKNEVILIKENAKVKLLKTPPKF